MAFDGDKKADRSLLYGPENRLKDWLVPLVPDFIETYHLTLVSLLWSLLVVVFGFLGRYDVGWLWGSSILIVLQYLTDLLDGEIGRRRKTGLVKWGFFMDHFIDYLFICALIIGYSFLFSDQSRVIIFFILALFGGFMVNSFLSFAATNRFEITFSGLGPTEARLFFILVNTLLIFLPDLRVIESGLPFVLGLTALGLFMSVYRTQKNLWRIDMERREKGKGRSAQKRNEERLRNLRLVRNFTAGFFLMLAAFVVYYLRILPPFHRGISLVLASWSLALWLFTIVTRNRPAGGLVRTILTYAVFLLFLGGVSYAGFALVPRPVPGNTREIRDALRLSADFAEMAAIREQLTDRKESLFVGTPDEREAVGRKVLSGLNELNILSERYAHFARIDFNSDPEGHSRAYALYFASRILQDEYFRILRDSGVPRGLWNKDSARSERMRRKFLQDLATADQVFRTGAGLQYFRLLKNRLPEDDLRGFDLEREAEVLLERIQSER
jgi:phosphatidylglycerophosphate synthase